MAPSSSAKSSSKRDSSEEHTRCAQSTGRGSLTRRASTRPRISTSRPLLRRPRCWAASHSQSARSAQACPSAWAALS
eukprot:26131_6